jgi:flagellar basal body-associated protein FliL
MPKALREHLKRFLKLLLVSLIFIVAVAVLSIIYGLIAHGVFTMRYVFEANFLVAILLITGGVVVMFLPSSFMLRKDRLVDGSTFIERAFEDRENRQQKARVVLWVGLLNLFFAGMIQLILSIVIQ